LGVTWWTSPKLQVPDGTNLLLRNRGLATAGSIVIAIDSEGQAWRMDVSVSSPSWTALPTITGGIESIAVGNNSATGSDWLIFALHKATPSVYSYRRLTDVSNAWTQATHSYGDAVRDMITISFGGLENKFVFGALIDGNYAVTGFQGGGWVKNWGKDMGSQ